ncbi:L-amino-acid oxidase-like isoform X2 [Mercenaria mercenaria]|uniref:L-amino-acid oxidase-like isoform X2 n=1 Tax=Mercenaria mercenaria TaxID=6596 RepID=UPI00234E7F20|nr:L-amino-acid oxidase-like isoform X2 [Mercenaria mercenaria]
MSFKSVRNIYNSYLKKKTSLTDKMNENMTFSILRNKFYMSGSRLGNACSIMTKIRIKLVSQAMMSRIVVVAFVILGFMVFASIIAIIILAERVNEISAKPNTDEDNIDTASCDDIAIVGAGISGSYAAWRLRDKGLKISMYEYSDRIGGRCFTVQLPDIPDVNIDMGAMRFIPSWHQLLNKTIHELGLEVEDLINAPAGDGGTLYYLRGKHMSYSELPTKAPYNIPENYRIDYDTLRCWDVFSGKYLDKETTNYIVDAAGYDFEFEGATAAQFVPTSNTPSGWNTARFKTPSKGFQAVPITMVEQFLNASTRHTFYKNFHLRTIKRNWDGFYLLKFHPTETKAGITSDVQGEAKRMMCARKVLLAIPKLALENLDWGVLKNDHIKDILKNSLVSIHAMKMFLGYDNLWWRNMELSSSKIISDTHLRATYDFVNLQSKNTSKAVYMAGYPDLSNEFWRHAQAFGDPVLGVGDKSIEMTNTTANIARNYLSQIFNVSVNDIPSPASAVMSIWDQYPIGASWYAWAPGYKWKEVESIMLKPSSTDDIYIISNTFSRNSSSTSGALELVEKALERIG